MNAMKEKYNVGILNDFKFIKMQNTCDPEFILWTNLSKKQDGRFIKGLQSRIVMLLIVGLTFLSVMSFKSYRQTIYAQFLPLLGQVGLKGLACQTMNDLTI